ncbi:hypothetical protein BS50DRAFT_595075 [Corynespora cassiicola Philippines]|uniref:Uncharacterized protein n=1 Tax=Corynespora cassiicola Philippines TaxID=1448308 RepID=A0A2T2N0E6_CORCC|nr:hypothetical protein BS50DRAFT_595075 [Corynespora cassiicola Philippines]
MVGGVKKASEQPTVSSSVKTRSQKSKIVEAVQWKEKEVHEIDLKIERLEQLKKVAQLPTTSENELEDLKNERERIIKQSDSLYSIVEGQPKHRISDTMDIDQEQDTPTATENMMVESPLHHQPSERMNSNQEENLPVATENTLPKPSREQSRIDKSPISKLAGFQNALPRSIIKDDITGVVWEIPDSNEESPEEPPAEIVKPQVVGTVRNEDVVRCGSDSAYSIAFVPQLPRRMHNDKVHNLASSRYRIVEHLFNDYAKSGQRQPPERILSNIQYLSIWWEGKMHTGHKAEIDILHPNNTSRKVPIRVLVYLDPKYYKDHDLENKQGFSHETKTTILKCLKGNPFQRRTQLYNKAVDLENEYERKHLSHLQKEDRGPRLAQLPYEWKKTPERRFETFSLSPSINSNMKRNTRSSKRQENQEPEKETEIRRRNLKIETPTRGHNVNEAISKDELEKMSKEELLNLLKTMMAK